LKDESEIKTELDFVDWYHDLEHGLLDASHDEYTLVFPASVCKSLGTKYFFDRAYQKQLELSKSHLDSLLSDTTSTLSLLSTLSESFRSVEAQTTTFQQHCEGLLKEQRRITGLANDLEANLKYYNYLEPVTRRLNAPGAGRLVGSTEFSEMLSRLDVCLEYMASHVSVSRFFRWALSNPNSPHIGKRQHTAHATAC